MDAPFPTDMLPEIEHFLAEVHPALPPGQDLYPEVFRTNLFFPLQRQSELAEMIRTARAIKPRVVMEIGADKGGGLYHWCHCLPTVEVVIACEIRGCPYRDAFARAFPRLTFTWMERASLPPPALTPRSIDILFIDGDKLGMEEDFDAYLPLMSPDGIVFLHDIQDREPQRAYYNLKERGYRGKVIVNLSDTNAALERADQGIPPSCPHEAWLRHWRGRSCGVGVIYLGEG